MDSDFKWTGVYATALVCLILFLIGLTIKEFNNKDEKEQACSLKQGVLVESSAGVSCVKPIK